MLKVQSNRLTLSINQANVNDFSFSFFYYFDKTEKMFHIYMKLEVPK